MIRADFRVPDDGSDRPAEALEVTGTKECYGFEGLNASPGYENNLAAVRLEPAMTPFEVSSLEIVVVGKQEGPCNAELPYRVEAYVAEADSPPSSPSLAASFDVARENTAGLEPTQIVTLPMPDALRIEAGQSLFVAVELPFLSDRDHACLNVCEDPYVPGVTFWSNASSPPYEWVALESFGINVNLDVRAYGRVVEQRGSKQIHSTVRSRPLHLTDGSPVTPPSGTDRSQYRPALNRQSTRKGRPLATTTANHNSQ